MAPNTRTTLLVTAAVLLSATLVGGAATGDVTAGDRSPNAETGDGVVAVTDPDDWSVHSIGVSVSFEAVVDEDEDDDDDDHEVRQVRWDFNGDGFVDASGTDASHTYGEPGRYMVTVTAITDDETTFADTIWVFVRSSDTSARDRLDPRVDKSVTVSANRPTARVQ